jgi:hypothetical protein
MTDEVPSQPQLSLVLRHHSDQLKPHEDASTPRIPICAFSTILDPPITSIEIAGENVAITVASPDHDDNIPMLYVFDWKSGMSKTVGQVNYGSGRQYFIYFFFILSPVPYSPPVRIQFSYEKTFFSLQQRAFACWSTSYLQHLYHRPPLALFCYLGYLRWKVPKSSKASSRSAHRVRPNGQYFQRIFLKDDPF